VQRQQDYFEEARVALNRVKAILRAQTDSHGQDRTVQSLDSAYAELDSVSTLIAGAEMEISRIRDEMEISRIRDEMESRAAEYRKRQDEILVLNSELRFAKRMLAKRRLEQEKAYRVRKKNRSRKSVSPG
jgi:hypothetical protein